jgi:hypothetical protein
MHRPLALALALATALPLAARAQSVADTSLFRPLALPTPNTYRSASGMPGPAYWQNRANYTIEATLDTATKEIRGSARILYENHSPDALDFLWLQVEQNLFARGSINEATSPPPLLFGTVTFAMTNAGFRGGLTIDRLTVGGRTVPRYLWDTMLRIDLPAPIRTGESVTIDVAWHFTVPVDGAGRMGRDGSLYEIAQWYPRLAVYDDVRGWNTMPYIGAGEFYLEYGDFDVRLTVPAGFVVAATGTLENADEVLTTAQRARLADARTNTTPVQIIPAAEAGNAARTRPATSGTLTWHFRADNVRDVAWAAAPNFRWDAVTWNGILIQALYRPSATLWANEGIRMAEHSIRYFSEQWGMYPYPQATTVEGPISGMEYPMLTFVPAETTREGLYWVLMHEFGHEWFPMMVGSDERRFPWMDEGFNTFIDIDAYGDYFRASPATDTLFAHNLGAYFTSATPGQEQPLITAPSEVRSLFFTAYQKPALMMALLREEVLGREAFDRAFREYVRRWTNRHPQPADFFRTMDNLTGRNLDWFWRGWIYTTARLDQAIDSVLVPAERSGAPAHRGTGAPTSVPTRAPAHRGTGIVQGLSGQVRIVLMNRGQMVMPAELKLLYDDGTSEVRKLPAEIWLLGSRHALTVDTGAKRLVGLEIDPRHVMPDVERANNRWGR